MADSDSITGKVIVSRKMSRDIKMRDLYLLVDDEEVDALQFGDSVELDLAPGEHRVKVTNRMFSKSKEFTLAAGEKAEFEVGNIPSFNPFTIVMLITGTMPYKVSLRQKELAVRH